MDGFGFGFDPLGDLGIPRRRKEAAFKPLPPEEQESTLKKVLGMGIGGLQYIGETLDKPGRAVRGLLAGRPSELMNLIPFSDTMGITDPAEATSGRDLLQSAGLIGENQVGKLDWGDVAGFAADVALDPLTYAGFLGSAVNKYGKSMRAIGQSTKGAAKYKTVGESLQHATPDMLEAAAHSLEQHGAMPKTTKLYRAEAKAGSAAPVSAWVKDSPEYKNMLESAGRWWTDDLDTANWYLKNEYPEGVLRSINVPAEAAEQFRVSNMAKAAGGKAAASNPAAYSKNPAKEFFLPREMIEAGANRIPESVLNKKLGGLFSLHVPFTGMSYVPEFASGPTAQAIGEALGSIPKMATKLPGVGPMLERGGTLMQGLFNPDVQNQFDPIAQQIAQKGSDYRKVLRNRPIAEGMEHAKSLKQLETDIGTNYASVIPPGQDAASVAARSVQHFAETAGAEGAMDYVTQTVGQFGDDIPRRAAELGEQMVSGQDKLKNEVLRRGVDMRELQKGEEFSHLARRRAEAEKLAGHRARTEGRAYIPVENYQRMLQDPHLLFASGLRGQKTHPAVLSGRLLARPEYREAIERAAQASGKSMDEIANNLAADLYQKGTGFIKSGKRYYNDDIIMNDVLYKDSLIKKLTNAEAMHDVAHLNLTDDPGGVLLSQAFSDAGLKSSQAMAYFGGKFNIAPEMLDGLRIPEDVASAITSVMKKNSSNPWLKATGEFIDKWTNVFRRNVTLPFPSFHSRNFLSGQWMNLASDLINSPADMGRYGVAMKEAWEMVMSGKHPELLQEMLIHEGIPRQFGSGGVDQLTDLTKGPVPPTLNPLSVFDPRNAFKEAQAATKAESSGYRAIDAARTGMGTIHRKGAEIAQQVEFMNRAPMYIYLKKKGWSAQAAAAKVRELQVDYSDLSDFEKNVMRRIVPFYTFTRKSVPNMVRQMVERPGGITAQTIRASNLGRSEGEFLPPYVGEGMAIGLGDNAYLSSLGLPTDQFSEMFAQGPSAMSTIRRTGEKLLSQTNPLFVKGPLELATGQNFYAGRPHEQLYRSPTNSILANAILHETPAARAITSLRTITDPRKSDVNKALNLGTGIRITNVSGGLPREMEIAENKMLTEVLSQAEGMGSFTKVYKQPDREISPETEKLYRAYLGIHQARRKRKKEKEKQAGG